MFYRITFRKKEQVSRSDTRTLLTSTRGEHYLIDPDTDTKAQDVELGVSYVCGILERRFNVERSSNNIAKCMTIVAILLETEHKEAMDFLLQDFENKNK